MSKELTEAQFSMQCSFIAKNAAAWAGDILTLPEHYSRPSDPQTVARFTDDIRGRLDRLDEWAGRKTMSEWEIRSNTPTVGHDEIVNAIARAILAERERCAAVAETIGTYPELNVFGGGPEWYRHAKRIANAIRGKIESGANAAADSSALASRSHEEAATEGKFDVTQ